MRGQPRKFFFDPNTAGVLTTENIFDPGPGAIMTPDFLSDLTPAGS